MGPPGESAACRGFAADASAWRARLGLRRLMVLYRLPVTISGAGPHDQRVGIEGMMLSAGRTQAFAPTGGVARIWAAGHGAAPAAVHGLSGFGRRGDGPVVENLVTASTPG